MTEHDWWTCTAPEEMLRLVTARPAPQELRQFALACCRRIAHLLPDDRARRFLTVAEHFSSGQADEEALRAARAELHQVERELPQPANDLHNLLMQARRTERRGRQSSPQTVAKRERLQAEIAKRKPAQLAVAALSRLGGALTGQTPHARWWAEEVRSKVARALPDGLAERRYQADLIRCLFANPFRTVNVFAEWRTPTVRSLAGVLAADGGALEGAALADALEEAGCTDEGLLGHCRGQPAHDASCWMMRRLLHEA